MTKQEVLRYMQHVDVVPVLRASSAHQALVMAAAISAGGIPFIEDTDRAECTPCDPETGKRFT
jgi:2-keto-3-deoxy-6-phosphogluconate aldolase